MNPPTKAFRQRLREIRDLLDRHIDSIGEDGIVRTATVGNVPVICGKVIDAALAASVQYAAATAEHRLTGLVPAEPASQPTVQ